MKTEMDGRGSHERIYQLVYQEKSSGGYQGDKVAFVLDRLNNRPQKTLAFNTRAGVKKRQLILVDALL